MFRFLNRNFVLLTHVFNLVATHIKHTSTNVLPQFLEFIITLMKLKLNCPFQDLAYRFWISISTVSRIFDKWIDIMSTRLQFLIVWPERERGVKKNNAISLQAELWK